MQENTRQQIPFYFSWDQKPWSGPILYKHYSSIYPTLLGCEIYRDIFLLYLNDLSALEMDSAPESNPKRGGLHLTTRMP